MKRIPTLPALKRFIALSIFVLAAVTASAQVYYLNVYGKGERTRYLISDLDSVSLSVDKAPIQGLEYVDLGLSSGLKWASMNLGATTPYEPGNYYAWGETEPKETYSYSTYKFKYVTAAQTSGVSKYNFNSVNGPVDYKYRLDMEDDAARVNWGEDWRMPTVEELSELMSECRWEWIADTSKNGFKGYKITGPNNNFIYLPVAQYRYDEGTSNYNEEFFVASYLSSTLFAEDCLQAMGMDLICEYYKGVWYSDFEISPQGRSFGELIRPVYSWKAPENYSPITHFDVAEKTINLSVGDKYAVKYQMDSTVFVSPVLTMTQSSGLLFINNEVIVAVLPGTYNVKANLGEFTVELTVTVAEPEIVAQAVDLGLSVKWATNNLGAETPSQFGFYYAWGETDPKSEFNKLNYKWYDKTSGKYSKYVTDTVNGQIDGKYILDIEDDAARQTWGGNWRMPTQDEFNELLRSCTWEWTTDNGVNGYKVTASNGNSIFLPAAGYDGVEEQGYSGTYWTSSLSSTTTHAEFYYYDDSYSGMTTGGRIWGFSIRPVQAYGAADADTLMLDQTKLELAPGAIYQMGIRGITVDGRTIAIDGVEWASSDKTVATVENGVITAVAEGSAIITATVNNKVLECAVTVIDASKPQIIDLGLSVKWASFNIGATSPEEFGNYYAWGETEVKDCYNDTTYKWYDVNTKTFTKYDLNPKSANADMKYRLDPDDDVAHVVLGDGWRLPTNEEFLELLENCSYSRVSYNGVSGYEFTSMVNGNTIFFPTAGYRYQEKLSTGYNAYMSSSLDIEYNDYKYNVFVKEDEYLAHYYRFSGYPVRAVYSSTFADNVLLIRGLWLDKQSVSLETGQQIQLKAIADCDTVIYLVWSSSDPTVARVDNNGTVVGVSSGECTITVSVQGFSESCVVTVAESTPLMEPIDLGLSVMWATANVGASRIEDYGGYYAWGETDQKAVYDWNSYKWANATDPNNLIITKYNDQDGLTVLDPDDDVAHVKWGGDWRMPTADEFAELFDNCTWTDSVEINGIIGRKATGPNGNSIFMPYAGFYSGESCNYSYGSEYATSSAYVGGGYGNTRAYAADYELWYPNRCLGFSVRPVRSYALNELTHITLNKESVSLLAGSTVQLSFKEQTKETFNVEWLSTDESVATVQDGLVTALSLGTCSVVAIMGELKDTCLVNVYTPEYVNLGLSVNWAAFNLGATNYDETGDYYSWGETEAKSSYDNSTYKFGEEGSETKYGSIDGKTILDPEDDAAHVAWGGDWRIPTTADFNELINNCTWEYTILDNGVEGCIITSNVKGYEDKSIFLPITGVAYSTGTQYKTEGLYWTSELNADYPYFLDISPNNNMIDYWYRYLGMAIRPVCPNKNYVPTGNSVVLTDNVTILVNDYVEGERRELAEPRIVADPAETTNQCIVVTTNANYKNNYDAQLMVVINESLVVGQRIELSMRGKADQWQRSGVESHTSPGQYVASNPFNAPYFDTDWSRYDWTIDVTDPSVTTYVFDLSYLSEGNNCYFDDISVRIIDTWEGELLLSRDELTISVGSGSVALSAYDNSGTGYNRFTQWSSSDETVATVDRNGNITAVSEGTAVITAEFRGVTATCTVTVAPYEPVLEYVNLGLSVNWATCNIGASDQLGTGFYYAWAETDQKSDYSWSTYSYSENGDEYSFTKYYYDPKSPDTNTDNLRVIQTGDDVAAQLMGGNWRMPTAYEFEELISYCNWETVSMDNVYGYLITSRVEGYTDNSIFLPLNGLKSGTSLYMRNQNGYYWTSSLYANGDASLARNLVLDRWGDLEVGQDDRFLGMSVRPVIPNENYVDKVIITDNVTVQVRDYVNGENVPQGDPRIVTDPENAYNQCIVVTTAPDPTNVYDQEFLLIVNEEMVIGQQINVSMRFKAENYQAAGQIVAKSTSGDALGFNPFRAPDFDTDWVTLRVSIPVTDTRINTYAFSLSYLNEGNNIYFDDISVNVSDSYSGGLFIDNGDFTMETGSSGVTLYLFDRDYDSFGNYATWTSSDEDVAKVDKNGVVTPVSAGTAVITAEFRGETASVTVTVNQYEPVKDYVDLGLSVNWATCNIGAYNPEDGGFYYAWGELTTTTDYSWSNYSYYVESEDGLKLNKYTDTNGSSSTGSADNLYVLQTADDVAAQLMGGNWRMATADEFNELINNCDWVLEYDNDGKPGYRITSKVEGYTDKSIYLPANGYRVDEALYGFPSSGYYWTSSFNRDDGSASAKNLIFDTYGGSAIVNSYRRYAGMAIRPVFPNENYVDKVLLSDNFTLQASEYPQGERVEKGEARQVADPDNALNQCIVVTTNSNPSNIYDTQFFINLKEALTPGMEFTVSMRIKADNRQSSECVVLDSNGGYIQSFGQWNSPYFETTWSNFTTTISAINSDTRTFAFNISSLDEGNNVYFDDIMVTVKDTYGGNLSLNQSELTLDLGSAAYQLSATDSYGVSFSNYATWTSSNESVATVDNSGRVTGVGIGTATITAQFRDDVATCSVTVKEYEPVTDVVDLGLSVNWATCNVGASSPEGIGFYYAWGEKETKTDYSLETYYHYSNEDPYGYKKYTLDYYDSYTGTADNKMVLEAADDVAAQLLGGNFRMATSVEFQELVSECQWQSETVNGVSGYRITSTIDGYTDKSIFIPANGYKSGTGTYSSSYGYYWTSSLSYSTTVANNLVISKSGWYSSTSSRITNNSREYGMGIRPVVPSETWQGITSIAISETSISMTEYENASLSAVLMSGDADYSFMADGLVWTSSDEDVVTVDENGQLLAIAAGEATITVTYNNISATCPVTVSAFSYEVDGTENNHEYVDLGLSVNWATFNVGSTSLTGLGDYFAWGEVETYYAEGYAQSNAAVWKSGKELGYVSESNRYYASEGYETQPGWTKYCSDPQNGKDEFTDDLTELVSGDDAASTNWGGTWRTPKSEEFTELQENCEWTWMTINGVEGFKIVSNVKGYEGKFIFLPCTGIRSYEDYYDGGGQYWSKTLYSQYPESAYALAFYSGYGYMTSFGRSEGMAVRAVCPKE